MAKDNKEYKCTSCGKTFHQWVGKCDSCGEWGTVEERAVSSSTGNVGTKTKRSTVIVKSARSVVDSAQQASQKQRIVTGIGEFDRVVGGGLIPGGVTLIAGSPGCGKSTLTLSIANTIAAQGMTSLIVSAEETEHQIADRAKRIGADGMDNLYVVAENNLLNVIAHIEDLKPQFLVIDSLQTIASPDIESAQGSVSQVKEVSSVITRIAKALEIPTIIIGHVTKDGNIAGPRAAEHVVDTVLHFEASDDSSIRMLRGIKNRFGPTDEVGCFEHAENGLQEVLDPSGVFLEQHGDTVSGVGVSVVMEGNRPMPVEIQSLVISSNIPVPRKVTSGLDTQRSIMIQAVTEKHGKVPLGNSDVYVSSMGGLKIKDTGVDVATVIALASAKYEYKLPSNIIGIGEVSLTGEVRRVSYMDRRLEEARRLGFEMAIVSKTTDQAKLAKSRKMGLTVVEVSNVKQLVDFLRNIQDT